MNKKAAKYGLWFYVLTMIIFLLFPKKVMENFYLIVIYFVVCLVFIFLMYFTKSTDSPRGENN